MQCQTCHSARRQERRAEQRAASEPRRGPGRPLTPGNEPGSDGNPKLSIRLEPAQRAEVMARGGAEWAREVLLRELAAGTDAPRG